MLADRYSLDLRHLCAVAGNDAGDRRVLGAKSWYFISVDYSLGAQLEADSRKVIDAMGGKLIGAVKHPINTPDFSSFLLQASPRRRT